MTGLAADRGAVATATPITLPEPSSTGPPEFPGLILVSSPIPSRLPLALVNELMRLGSTEMSG